MLIKVQLTTGHVLSLEVAHDQTVFDIKQMVCDSEGVPPLQQKMLYAAQQLANNRTVGELGLQPGSVVQLVLNLRGGAPRAEAAGGPVSTSGSVSGSASVPGPVPASAPTSPTVPDLLEQARCVLEGESHWLANAANLAALIFEALPRINWAGFYFMAGEGASRRLVLGPFAGRVACTQIRPGEGVCGAAAQRRETLVVPDVHAFPGHIACDSRSASEIVVPLVYRGEVLGVLDVDSPEPGRFAGERGLLEALAGAYLGASGASLAGWVGEAR